METVSVAFCFNDAYCTMASGAISSLIRYSTAQYHYDIYIVHDDISAQNQYLIKTLATTGNINITFVKIEFSRYTTADISYSRHSKYTFARLFFHKIFSKINKILYLDSDLIVTSDIAELFNQNLEGCAVGACLDYVAELGSEKLKKTRLTPLQRIGFEQYEHHYDYFSNYLNLSDNCINTYFNAGVLLMDLKKAGSVFDMKSQELLKRRYIMVDQDILNIIFKDDKKILNQKFNVFDTNSIKYINETGTLPVIIHYNGPIKPTSSMTRPMAYRYWEEVSKTPYYYPAIEAFITKYIAQQKGVMSDSQVIEDLFYNLKRFKKLAKRRRFIRMIIKLLVDSKKYKKLKDNPDGFFRESKSMFIRFLGRYYD